MREWVDVATLTKTKNLKGRFVAKRAANLLYILEQGIEVAFVPPRVDVVRRAVVAETRGIDGERYEVIFDGVDAAEAEVLVGCHCLVRRELVDLPGASGEPSSWVGWRLVSLDGEAIGTISDIRENPGQALIEAVRADGEGRILVPAVGEIVVDVIEDEGVVVVDLPDGLLEL